MTVRRTALGIVAVAALASALGACPASAEDDGLSSFQQAPPPANPDADARQLFEEGVELVRAQDLSAARNRFERVVELRPDQPAAYYYLGMIALQYQETDEAIRHLERAVELNPNEAHPWYLLATAYASYGSLESAEKAYLKTLEADPNLVNARHDLGLLYYRMQEPWKSAEMLESALQGDGGSTKTMLALGIVYFQMKKPERVLEYITLLRERGDEAKASQLERLLVNAQKQQEAPPLVPDILEPEVPLAPGLSKAPAKRKPQANPFARQRPPAAQTASPSPAGSEPSAG